MLGTGETWVRSLGGEDPLEEGVATHSSILAWRIPLDGGAWRLQSVELQRQTGQKRPSTHAQIRSRQAAGENFMVLE